MKNKCEKMYAIFMKDVVVSDNILLNAITGFNIHDEGRVLTVDDVCKYAKKRLSNHYNDDYMMLLKNDLTGEQWYLSYNIIAYAADEGLIPEIVMVSNYDIAIISRNTRTDYLKFLSIRQTIANVKIIEGKIGNLSTPHNFCYPNNLCFKHSSIKLPFSL